MILVKTSLIYMKNPNFHARQPSGLEKASIEQNLTARTVNAATGSDPLASASEIVTRRRLADTDA